MKTLKVLKVTIRTNGVDSTREYDIVEILECASEHGANWDAPDQVHAEVARAYKTEGKLAAGIRALELQSDVVKTEEIYQ